MKTHKISKILDKYLPAHGEGTEREQLRMDLHREFSSLAEPEIDDAKVIRVEPQTIKEGNEFPEPRKIDEGVYQPIVDNTTTPPGAQPEGAAESGMDDRMGIISGFESEISEMGVEDLVEKYNPNYRVDLLKIIRDAEEASGVKLGKVLVLLENIIPNQSLHAIPEMDKERMLLGAYHNWLLQNTDKSECLAGIDEFLLSIQEKPQIGVEDIAKKIRIATGQGMSMSRVIAKALKPYYINAKVISEGKIRIAASAYEKIACCEADHPFLKVYVNEDFVAGAKWVQEQ